MPCVSISPWCIHVRRALQLEEQIKDNAERKRQQEMEERELDEKARAMCSTVYTDEAASVTLSQCCISGGAGAKENSEMGGRRGTSDARG